MRPVKLEMTAFGPYAGKEVLPLDELGRSGLYLITGVTGIKNNRIGSVIPSDKIAVGLCHTHDAAVNNQFIHSSSVPKRQALLKSS